MALNYGDLLSQTTPGFAEDIKKATGFKPVTKKEISQAYKQYNQYDKKNVAFGRAKGQTDQKLYAQATKDVLEWYKSKKTADEAAKVKAKVDAQKAAVAAKAQAAQDRAAAAAYAGTAGSSSAGGGGGGGGLPNTAAGGAGTSGSGLANITMALPQIKEVLATIPMGYRVPLTAIPASAKDSPSALIQWAKTYLARIASMERQRLLQQQLMIKPAVTPVTTSTSGRGFFE